MKFERKFFIFLTLLTALAVCAFGFIYQQPAKLPVLAQIPEFSLMDADAKEFSSQRLQGKVFVADFIFTTCSGICPLMTKNLKGIYQAFTASPDVHFVSATVNPEFDSPGVLKDYARKYGIDAGQWHFLTGSREKIQDLAVQGFKVGSVDDMVFHSGYLVLADKNSRIRGYYDGTKEEQVKKLVADIRALLKER